MAFTVENGTGIVGANSYATVAEFEAYFGDRPEDISGIISPGGIEDLLVCASSYIDTRWADRFKGERRWSGIHSRSVLMITAQPSDGETVTFSSTVYTFRTTPSLDTEVEIGTDLIVTLANLSAAIALNDTDDFLGSEFADEDTAALTLFAIRDGIATTETLADGSFDSATTSGRSRKKQPMQWPRDKVRDSDGDLVVGIPQKLKEATFEYAFRANSLTLDPDPTVHESGRPLTRDRVRVGPIETDVQFSDENTGIRITRPFPRADRLLSEFVIPGKRVVRN